ncbi:MAG: DUF3043 domain-containing protein [Microbacteriaceae bacterium]
MAKNANNSPDDSTVVEVPTETISGKGRPTPTRKEKEDARKRPLVSNDRSEARKNAREKMRAERDKQRVGMENGVERFLPIRDRGPQKKWVRDYVDARTSVGEFMLPVLGVVVVLYVFPQVEVQLIMIGILWLFLIAAFIDALILGRIVRRKLGEKFGVSKVETGVRWYAGVRAMQLRAMRLPKPQVRRRAYPE